MSSLSQQGYTYIFFWFQSSRVSIASRMEQRRDAELNSPVTLRPGIKILLASSALGIKLQRNTLPGNRASRDQCTYGPINGFLRRACGCCLRVCILTMKSPFRQCLLLLSDYSGRRYKRDKRAATAVAVVFARLVIRNLCNVWKSDDAAIITQRVNPILFVTIGSSLFCTTSIKTRFASRLRSQRAR